ncbi:MAG: ATP-dependent DNA ligase [Halobacteria archaeon]|nr:ATP-dependent DNA ligase [Halobacteria archaeon]
MNFDEFADRVESIEEMTGDHEITDEVASLLSEADSDLGIAARFVQGRIFPAWDERKLEIGPSLLYDALSLASGASSEEVEELVKETGDVGEAAESLDLSGQQTLTGNDLTLEYLYGSLEELAETSGEGSQENKVRSLADLFMDCDPLSSRYLARLVLGEMRVGVGEGTVRDAVTEAFDVNGELVERGIMVTNDVGEVAAVARDEGDEGLDGLEMVVGRPVKPMLAQTGDAETALEETSDGGESVAEWKYDGARLQIHVGDDGVTLYSRNLENLTSSLPDVVEIVKDDVSESRLILDAEVVATEDGDPLAFQEVLRRLRRKYRIDEMRDEVELELHVFDLLYRDAELIDLPLRERYEHLEDVVDETRSKHRFVSTPDEVRETEHRALEEGHEGLMVKNPGSTYSPGSRGKNWLKIKPEPETLDLVVTGGEWGEGRRANLVGSYLLAARDEDGFRTVGKVATGLTDERLEELTERFDPLIESEDGKEIEFKPEVVFEVGYEEIQESPEYTSGYALRFPRFLGVRDDKDVEDADTVDRIERIHSG